jgi:hypothetical protein
MCVNTAIDERHHAPARPHRAHPAPAGDQRCLRGQARRHSRAVPHLAAVTRASREGRRARRVLPWNAHHEKAIEAGVSAESIKELASNEVPHFAHADEQLPYGFATQILRGHFVDQETFDAALAEWGEAGVVDIIGCLGNFSMLAMLLNTFQVDLKPGDEPPFPDVRGFAKVDQPPAEG